MAPCWKKLLPLGIGILLFGAARLPFEAGLSRNLKESGLFPPVLEVGTRERIGQTSSAVALGGLRTLVATFLNLRTVGFFSDREWSKLEETLETVVALAPRTGFYWETGSWHLAYNASSYYLRDSTLPVLRRKEAWRTYIHKGRAFLERGIRNNPDDWNLHANLGFLLTDTNKLAAFRDPNECFIRAELAYRQAVKSGKALPYLRRARLYALARIEGRQAEALDLAKALYAESPSNRTPTLLVLLLVLQAHQSPGYDITSAAIECFHTPQEAYETLSNHWRRTRERFPVDGVSTALQSLETTLRIPENDSIFRRPAPVPPKADDWFHE